MNTELQAYPPALSAHFRIDQVCRTSGPVVIIEPYPGSAIEYQYHGRIDEIHTANGLGYIDGIAGLPY